MKVAIIVLSICLVKLGALADVPKEYHVYEDYPEEESIDLKENTRVARDHDFKPRPVKLHKPPTFNYQGALQQDQRKNRYVQQQIVDLKNILIPATKSRNKDVALRLPNFPRDWSTKDVNDDHTDEASDKRVHFRSLESDENRRNSDESLLDGISESTTRTARSSRKMQPDSYFEDAQTATDRQDHANGNDQIVYVNPEFIRQHLKLQHNIATDQNINALNALIGQKPNNQLEGLRRLLQNPGTGKNQHAKDHTPITEQTIDVPNPQNRPNVKVEHIEDALKNAHDTIQAIQEQLDQRAKIQTEQALAKARLEADAQVTAQHQAIYKAQKQVEKAVLAEIAAHNQAYSVVPGPIIANRPHDQAQKVTSAGGNPAYTLVPGPVVPSKLEVLQFSPHGNLAHPQPLALPLQAEVIPQHVHTYAPSHDHRSLNYINAQAKNEALLRAQAQAEAEVQAERSRLEAVKKNNLAKISITKTHSVTQEHRSPTNYQHVVLKSQHQQAPNVRRPYAITDEGEKHQYAARYAFGYRIRDAKMGNDFGHEEKREGKNAKGRYHVLLPDGRLQRVEYYADPSGYHAKVSYENIAHH